MLYFYNQRFSDVFRDYRNGTLALKGLITVMIIILKTDNNSIRAQERKCTSQQLTNQQVFNRLTYPPDHYVNKMRKIKTPYQN